MFEKMLAIINNNSTQDQYKNSESKVILAALFVKLARIDDDYTEQEKLYIIRLLEQKFQVTEHEAKIILNKAEELESYTVDTVQLTREIKKEIPYEKRQELVIDLWSIVLADQCRTAEESCFMRLCIKLLGISDVDSAHARKSALNKITQA